MSLTLSESEPKKQEKIEEYEEEDFHEDDELEMTDSDDSENEDETPQTTNAYKTSFSATALKKGNTELSYAEAKLYGLLDEHGKIKKKTSKSKAQKNPNEIKKHINRLSETKREQKLDPGEDPEVAECSFAPRKSKEAERAMKNSRCGYDFVSRLQEKGDFMERMNETSAGGSINKAMLDAQKEDYEARLDKLQCPKCRKYQSFDEFVDKRRHCGACKERYTKLHVSKGRAWEQKQKENELMRRVRLAKIEEDAYGPCSFAPKTGPGPPNGKRLMTLEERVQSLLVAQKEEARRARADKDAEEERKRKKEHADVTAARERAKERQKRENRAKASSPSSFKHTGIRATSVSNIASRPSSAVNAKRKSLKTREEKSNAQHSVSYDKTQGNVSEKFQMLINSDMDSLQNALL